MMMNCKLILFMFQSLSLHEIVDSYEPIRAGKRLIAMNDINSSHSYSTVEKFKPHVIQNKIDLYNDG